MNKFGWFLTGFDVFALGIVLAFAYVGVGHVGVLGLAWTAGLLSIAYNIIIFKDRKEKEAKSQHHNFRCYF